MQPRLQEISLHKGYVFTVEVLQGKAPSKIHRVYILLIFFFFAVMCLIAQNLFPEPYSFLKNSISDQGCPLNNPNGYFLFNIGIIVLGLLLIPHFLYLSHVLRQIMPGVALITLILGLIGSTGMIFVGIFPKHLEPIHGIVARITFIAFFFYGNGTFIIFLQTREFLKSFRSRSKGLIIFLVLFNISFAGLIIACIFLEKPPGSQEIFHTFFPFSIWEWLYFLVIMGWLIGAFILVNQIELTKLPKRSNQAWPLFVNWLQFNSPRLDGAFRKLLHKSNFSNQ
jgi:hypothetical membrane protein